LAFLLFFGSIRPNGKYVPQMAVFLIFINISFTPISGMGTSSIHIPRSGFDLTSAFIVFIKKIFFIISNQQFSYLRYFSKLSIILLSLIILKNIKLYIFLFSLYFIYLCPLNFNCKKWKK